MMCRFYGDESATDWIRLVLSEDDSRIHTDLNAYARSIIRNETINCIRLDLPATKTLQPLLNPTSSQ